MGKTEACCRRRIHRRDHPAHDVLRREAPLGRTALSPKREHLLDFYHRITSQSVTTGVDLFKRLATIAVAVVFAASTALGTAGVASATTVPDASCINSAPYGLSNIISCSLDLTVQVPIDLPDCLLNIGNIFDPVRPLNGAELDLIETVIKEVINNMEVADNLPFKQALVDALNNTGIFDDIDIDDIDVSCF